MKKKEIKDTELEEVNGGDVTSANIVGTVRPHCRPLAGDVSLHNTDESGGFSHNYCDKKCY